MPLMRVNVLPLATILIATIAYSAEVGLEYQRIATASAERRISAQPMADQQYWQLFRSTNFTVCCPRWFDGNAALARCESLRQALSQKWLATELDAWTSRCYVVLHPNKATYTQAAGRGSEQTAGCSTVKEWNGRVQSRRIDLRLDRLDPLSHALPHELTHVVLADVVASDKLPRWADEGMAMLADADEKRGLHGRDLISALGDRRTFRLAELLTMADYPSTSRQREFYSQSLSLVSFLAELKTPQTFLQFARAGVAKGYDTALREHYGINNVNELEQAWLAVAASEVSALTVAVRGVSQ
jgi:hypothetical protein